MCVTVTSSVYCNTFLRLISRAADSGGLSIRISPNPKWRQCCRSGDRPSRTTARVQSQRLARARLAVITNGPHCPFLCYWILLLALHLSSVFILGLVLPIVSSAEPFDLSSWDLLAPGHPGRSLSLVQPLNFPNLVPKHLAVL